MMKAFITNLGKYNEGELIGEWVSFPVSEDEIEKVFNRIGINEVYEEYFVTDYETDIPGLAEYFGEYPNIESMNEVMEIIDNFSAYELDVLKTACEVWNFNEVIENDIDDYYLIADAYDDYDLGYYWINESGCYDLSNMGFLSNYFDYESFGRDYRLESDGGFTSCGYIEYRN